MGDCLLTPLQKEEEHKNPPPMVVNVCQLIM